MTREVFLLIKKIFKGGVILFTKGPLTFMVRLKKNLRIHVSIQEQYKVWLKKNVLSKKEIKKIKDELKTMKYRPLISIIMPVYNVDKIWLEKAINSVLDQLYPHWELCAVDDCSTNNEARKVLESYKVKDKRIKIKSLPKNLGISLASNEALALATGEFIGYLDHDDKITLDALYEVVKLLQKHPEADMIYSDEDKITTEEIRCEPFFKPDWSPDLFLSQMYTCHFGIYRKSIVDKIGGLNKGFEGSQDYDFVLRFTEETEKIFHIPKILYHWRKIPGSTADKYDAKDSTMASLKALNKALKRRSIKGTVEKGAKEGTFCVRRQITDNPLISIIIPTKDKLEYLEKCIESIETKTRYKNYEILIVDNDSVNQQTIDYLKSIHNKGNCRLLNYNTNGNFNFSSINNHGAEKSNGQFLLFLNNDTEVIAPGWLNAMLELAQRAETGAVGAKLIYKDNTIQHAGIILGIGGIANHAFYKLPENYDSYMIDSRVIRNYSAITAACLMVKKSLFEELGGFDEVNLPISYNDVDFCLRLQEKGYSNVFTPNAVLYHFESISRNPKVSDSESGYMTSKWKNILDNDPYYNINLTRGTENFELNV